MTRTERFFQLDCRLARGFSQNRQVRIQLRIPRIDALEERVDNLERRMFTFGYATSQLGGR